MDIPIVIFFVILYGREIARVVTIFVFLFLLVLRQAQKNDTRALRSNKTAHGCLTRSVRVTPSFSRRIASCTNARGEFVNDITYVFRNRRMFDGKLVGNKYVNKNIYVCKFYSTYHIITINRIS